MRGAVAGAGSPVSGSPAISKRNQRISSPSLTRRPPESASTDASRLVGLIRRRFPNAVSGEAQRMRPPIKLARTYCLATDLTGVVHIRGAHLKRFVECGMVIADDEPDTQYRRGDQILIDLLEVRLFALC